MLPNVAGGAEAVFRHRHDRMPMRRYWMISLAIGGGAALVVLALLWGGALKWATAWLADFYAEKRWSVTPEFARVRWIEIPVMVGAAFAAAAVTVEAAYLWQKLVVTAVLLKILAMLSPTLALYGILFDPFPPLLAAALASGGGLVFSQTDWGRRRRLLEEALGYRVSSAVFTEMLDAPQEPEFAGARREASTLVCRLFLPGSPREDARTAEVLSMGSLFLRTVSAFLLARGAYLEEAGPERVKATFGMLKDEPDHAMRACGAALDLRGRLRALSIECESRWFRAPGWGIGIGSGSMVVGLCGTPGRYFFSGVGGEADFADRLALANLRYGSDLLISPDTYRLVSQSFEVRPMEMLYDPGRQSLLEVYQLLASREAFSEEERARRDCFWQGVVHLRAGDWEAALERFSRARATGSDDAVLARLVAIAQDGVTGPESRPLRLVRELTEEGHARPLPQL